MLRRLIKTFFHPGGALPNLHTEVMILWRHLLAAAPAFLSSRAERPFSPGELLRRELMALSTSSSDGSAPELMTCGNKSIKIWQNLPLRQINVKNMVLQFRSIAMHSGNLHHECPTHCSPAHANLCPIRMHRLSTGLNKPFTQYDRTPLLFHDGGGISLESSYCYCSTMYFPPLYSYIQCRRRLMNKFEVLHTQINVLNSEGINIIPVITIKFYTTVIHLYAMYVITSIVY